MKAPTLAAIIDQAAAQHGGREALMAKLPAPADPVKLRNTPDDRILSAMTQGVFNAGFNWRVIEQKWPGFEAAFEGFEPSRWMFMDEDDVRRLLGDERIVRHEAKIRSVASNAALVRRMAQEGGSAGRFLEQWPQSDFVGLLQLLKKDGARLGGNTGQYLLRRLGMPSLILTGDVTAALIDAGIIDRAPGSLKAMKAIQKACNQWHDESGLDLTSISRVLALSRGPKPPI